MNVMVSALSLALTVIASSLPAHFSIFDILHTIQYKALEIIEVHRLSVSVEYRPSSLPIIGIGHLTIGIG